MIRTGGTVREKEVGVHRGLRKSAFRKLEIDNLGKSEQSRKYESGYLPNMASCVLLAVWKRKEKSWFIRA